MVKICYGRKPWNKGHITSVRGWKGGENKMNNLEKVKAIVRMNNLEKVKAIVRMLGPNYSIYENYSGRFMFGEKCLGIVGPSVEEIKKASKRFRKAQVDNMGLNYIVYWPHLKG